MPFLAGCSAISIPLGDVFGQKSQANAGATVSSVPVTSVTSQPLPPLPRQTANVEADPITTGSIPAQGAAIPYSRPPASLAQSNASLTSSGLAAIPPARPAPVPAPALLSAEDMALVAATLPNALLDQETAATLPWLNEGNGHGGLVVPVGSPVRQGNSICRALVISLQQRGQPSEWLQANACRSGDQAWQLGDQRAWRNPA